MLELFRFQQSLEAIDKMDKTRLSRAMQSLRYRDAWERHHNRIDPSREAQAIKKAKERDSELVEELVRARQSLLFDD